MTKRRTGWIVPVLLGLLFVLMILVIGTFLGPKILEAVTGGRISAESGADPYPELAANHPEVTIDRESGEVFVNDELVILAAMTASREDIAALAQAQNAVITGELADIGCYVFRFDGARTREEMDALCAALEENPLVDSAYRNPVMVMENSEETAADEPAGPEEPAGETAVETPTEPGSETIAATAAESDAEPAAEPAGEDAGETPEETAYEVSAPTAAPDSSAAAPQVRLPLDRWGGDGWNINTPSGNNWGMEAVRAPVAWNYLDEMSEVHVGLIDSTPSMGHEDLAITGHQILHDLDTDATTTEILNATNMPTGQDHGSHVAGIIGATWDNTAAGTDGVSGMMGDRGTLHYAAYYDVRNGQAVNDYYTGFGYVSAICDLLEQDVQAINISQNTSRLIGFAASRGNENAINHLTAQAELAGNMLARVIEQRRSQGRPDFVICVAAGNVNNKVFLRDEDELYGYRDMGDFCWPCELKLRESGDAMALYNNFLNLIDNAQVKSRIIVVGSVGIESTTGGSVRYHYSNFSNVGARVDIVAPGEDIYSCYAAGYGTMSGTSMATPHVTGAAGLLFATNPRLTGPEVKDLLISTSRGRYYYTDGVSGLLDVGAAVEAARETRTESVIRVARKGGVGLDLCFVVDTTGSMGDDIDNARSNMRSILSSLSHKTGDYRIAIVDYRDYPDRTGHSVDYPARVQLNFTGNDDDIINAINGLDLGHGGDIEETVYSGIAQALALDWRSSCQRAVIILGDAGPLDPEPNTGYTLDSVVDALYNASVVIDSDASDTRVLGEAVDSLMRVYAIGSWSMSDTSDPLTVMAETTGGYVTSISSASAVTDAIVDSIESIDVTPTYTVNTAFRPNLAGDSVDLYRDGEYLFSYPLGGDGAFTLRSMPAGEYAWRMPVIGTSGAMTVPEGGGEAEIRTVINSLGASSEPLLRTLLRTHVPALTAVFALAAVVTAIPMTIWLLVRRRKARKG